MRIAAGTLALVCALVIFVESLSAAPAGATQNGATDASFGLVVAVLFLVGGVLLFANVVRGSLWVWVGAAGNAFTAAAASPLLSELNLCGAVAVTLAAAAYVDGRKRARAAGGAAPETSVLLVRRDGAGTSLALPAAVARDLRRVLVRVGTIGSQGGSTKRSLPARATRPQSVRR